MPKRLLLEVAGIAGGSILLIALLSATGWDLALAIAAYAPGSRLASYSSSLPDPLVALLSLGLLPFLILPPLFRRHPLWQRVAAVWFATYLVGFVLLAGDLRLNVLRARPTESREVVPTAAYTYAPPFVSEPRLRPEHCVDRAGLHGDLKLRSFPSGRVASALLLCTPFFVLRRSRPRLARRILAAGVLWSVLVGAGRVIGGHHYLSDVIGAVPCVLVPAAVFAELRWARPDAAA
jgi:membrane-associated phospholipid phosphatase